MTKPQSGAAQSCFLEQAIFAKQLFVPFGTLLGVFTIVALSRESVRVLFSKATAQAPG